MLGEPTANTCCTEDARPRTASGTISWSVVCRTMLLMPSSPPTNVRNTNESQKELDTAKRASATA